MNGEKYKQKDISIGIIVNQDGEIMGDFTDEEEARKPPFIKPKVKKKDEKDKPS